MSLMSWWKAGGCGYGEAGVLPGPKEIRRRKLSQRRHARQPALAIGWALKSHASGVAPVRQPAIDSVGLSLKPSACRLRISLATRILTNFWPGGTGSLRPVWRSAGGARGKLRETCMKIDINLASPESRLHRMLRYAAPVVIVLAAALLIQTLMAAGRQFDEYRKVHRSILRYRAEINELQVREAKAQQILRG